jgi:hypothetical protein
LLAASKWWPLAARLAAALDRHGCRVDALCPQRHVLTHLAAVRTIYRYGRGDPMASLRAALLQSTPDIVIPCDEGAVAQLHVLHAAEPSLRTLIERSLGPADSYRVIDSRCELLKLAADLGIRVPKTRKVMQESDLISWHENVAPTAVVKVNGDSGGNGVRISQSPAESIAAFHKFRAPRSLAAAWKQRLIDRDPLALWRRVQPLEREVSIQEFIRGRPANSMLACWRGELLGIVSVVVVAAEGATGAAIVVRVIRNEKMRRAAELLVAKLNLSGFYGLDFVIEAASGTPYLIEMNPRCTQLGHLELPRSGSLAGALGAVLTGRPTGAGNPIRSDTIALFPRALFAGKTCRAYVESGYHDVPEQPDLLLELMKPPWPQRQWASRLYHALNPPQHAEAMIFDSPGEQVPELKTLEVKRLIVA